MFKQVLILIAAFYILVLLQASFLPHFLPWVNFVLPAVLLINLFERPEKHLGIFAAVLGGFLLDVFSGRMTGFYTAILFVSAMALKAILKNYIRLPGSFSGKFYED